MIPQTERTPSGYWQYSSDIVKRVKFIKSAQELGFPLIEIKEILALRLGNVDQCNKVRRMAEEKIREIEDKIMNLKKIKKALLALTEECKKTNPSNVECPILKALDSSL